MDGIIVKGIGGFYYVSTEKGVFQCRARGIFKKDGITPTVGDAVKVELLDDEEGVVQEIKPRKNHFIRPAIANIDVMAVCMAVKDPEPNFSVTDRLLVTAEKSRVEILICMNKTDIDDGSMVDRVRGVYGDIYEIFPISCRTMSGLDKLKTCLQGKKVAFTGPSGAGKSTIINSLQRELVLETGMISNKTKRGRHTTRHVEMFNTDFGAVIYDTPGFTSFEIGEISEEELQWMYPEMTRYIGKCKYQNCRHIKEPGCAVRVAVDKKEISASRYDSYMMQLEEIKARNKFSKGR